MLKSKTSSNFGGIVVLLLIVACIYGYFANIVELVRTCDFSPETSYKCEVIRGVGIFAPPIGIIAGYVSIDP